MRKGERINGRYKIIKNIGTGGMANVYLAEDLILEREVAVKMMSVNFQEDEQNLRRFQREALSTTELDHPNIVNIYDVGEGEQPYIVMEHIDGMDLKDYIKENHPIPYQKVIDIMSQILDGIAYAHQNNVIHRDIKPHNILIFHNGHVKITDFGIALAISQNSITQTNSLLGSVQYMSPEQARGNIVTKKSDIYSLGIVLYELLTGTVPFDGESAVSVALKHFQSDIPSLKEFDSRLPQPLENVVLKATAKEAQNRYNSVEEMKEDLETALSASRRNEEKFVAKDLNDEKTMVLDAKELKTKELATKDAKSAETINKKIKDKNNKKKSKLKIFILIPILLVIGLVIFLVNSQPKQVIISEDILGTTLEEATSKIEDQMLELGEVNEQPNDDVEEGLVFKVNPKEGSSVLEGAKVDLYLSLGEKPFKIEDYVGREYEEVRAELTELGFEVNKEELANDEVASGKIIEQDLAENEEVIISETEINFVVSTGKPVFELRNLSGYSRAGVDDYVEGRGLTLNAKEESSEDIALGLVISQEPSAGTNVKAGDSLTVVYSTGPEESTNIAFSKQIELPYEEKYEDPDDESSKLLESKIEIYIGDSERDIKDLAHELKIKANQKYSLNFVVEEGGKAQYRIFRDGEKITDESVKP
ncbi:MAG: Stk1 family PASTA domain-containing Ser/Thr kinase [Atopostipes suicloacalis]|nr:Stk1 family PASTA domain-containing Ser/Thr kinase [Atopostipes suicloacalis]